MWRGWGEMFRVKGIWWLLVAPVIINMALFAVAIAFYYTRVAPFVFRLFENEGVLANALEWIVAIAFLVALVIVYAFLFSIVAEILGAPFYEEIGARVDKRHNISIVERPWYKEVLMTISQESRKLVAIGCVMILAFFLQFIPIVGQVVSAVIGFAMLVLTLGADAVGPALYRRGLMLNARRRWVLKNAMPVIGMGLAKALGLVIPVLNIVVLPMSASGGTLLVQKYDKRPL